MEIKKYEIKSITEDFREIIKTYGFKCNKTVIKHLRKSLRSHEKIVCDENEDDIEYLQERVNYLNKLLKVYTKQNQYHDMTAMLNITVLKLLTIYLKTMMKITICTKLTTNNINHFQARYY